LQTVSSFPVGLSYGFDFLKQEGPADWRDDLLTEMRVGAANTFEHDPDRSEGADPKGAIIRR
jgi:hypothetical protein